MTIAKKTARKPTLNERQTKKDLTQKKIRQQILFQKNIQIKLLLKMFNQTYQNSRNFEMQCQSVQKIDQPIKISEFQGMLQEGEHK